MHQRHTVNHVRRDEYLGVGLHLAIVDEVVPMTRQPVIPKHRLPNDLTGVYDAWSTREAIENHGARRSLNTFRQSVAFEVRIGVVVGQLVQVDNRIEHAGCTTLVDRVDVHDTVFRSVDCQRACQTWASRTKHRTSGQPRPQVRVQRSAVERTGGPTFDCNVLVHRHFLPVYGLSIGYFLGAAWLGVPRAQHTLGFLVGESTLHLHMDPTQSIDWNDITPEVQLWIKATKPESTHAAWTKMVRKKSNEHWIEQIAGDVEYQRTLPAIVTVFEIQEPVEDTVQEPVHDRRKRKLRAPTRDSFESTKKKHRARVDTPMPLSSSSKKARAAAVARASIHGSAAADEAGVVAAAHVQASESLSTGIGSIHAGERWMMGRRGSPPNSKLKFSSHRQHQLYIDALERSGLAGLNSNPAGLYENSTLEELKHVATAPSLPVANFGPLSSMASSSLPSRLFSSDSLDEVTASSDQHLQALQNTFAPR